VRNKTAKQADKKSDRKTTKTEKKSTRTDKTIAKKTDKKTDKKTVQKTVKKQVKKTVSKKTAVSAASTTPQTTTTGKTMTKKKEVKSLTAKQIEFYRDLLLEKRREIQGDVSMMEENIFQSGGDISSMPVHLADIGTDSYEQEFSLGLMAEEKKILTEIHKALDRINDGSYGICEGLDTPIEHNRLEAIPWTRFSLEYARLVESGQDPRLDSFKRRPIDIEREEDSDEDDDTETEEVAEKIDFDDSMESLDELEEEEDSDYADDDIDRQRDSA
jgi:DnaK suppressor protein